MNISARESELGDAPGSLLSSFAPIVGSESRVSDGVLERRWATPFTVCGGEATYPLDPGGKRGNKERQSGGLARPKPSQTQYFWRYFASQASLRHISRRRTAVTSAPSYLAPRGVGSTQN